MGDGRKPQWEKDLEPLDYSASSAATNPEGAAQDESTSIKTGRHAYTENATFTKEPMEASSNEFETLNQLNRNFYADEDKQVGREQQKQDRVNDVAAWGEQIGLTSHEIERAATIVLTAEESFARRHGEEGMILAALTLAANESTSGRNDERKAIRPQSPISEDTTDMAETYEEIRKSLDVTTNTVKKCRKHLRESM